MKINRIKKLLFGTLRRQLIVGLSVTTAITMTLFVWDVTLQQVNENREQQNLEAIGLSRGVAASSIVWVASRDFSGLQEIVKGLAHYPDLQYAMVLDLEGQVLAHNDPARIGQYLTDLTPQKDEAVILGQSASQVDVASPVMLNARLIGWVRIGLSRNLIDEQISKMTRDAIVFVLIAIATSILIAILAARFITRRLYIIQQVADAVESGTELRAVVPGNDEAAQLARKFNHMLDGIQQREEQLRSFYELDLVGLTITSPEKGWIRINEHLCKMLEYTEQELRGMTWTQLTHPDDLAADMQLFNKLLANEISGYSLEKRFISRTGKIVPALLVVRCVRKANGEIKYVTAMVEDITERKQAEIVYAQHKAALETTRDGFWMVDSKGFLLEINQAYAEMIGYSLDELRGMHVSQLESKEQSAEEVNAHIDRVIEQGSDLFETRHRHKDGHEIDVEISASFMPNTQQVVAFCRDISMRKADEKKIERLAFYDSLTQLPNRHLLMDRLQHSIASCSRSGKTAALLFIDLDNFKTINDTLGHDVGDQLLKKVAERLTTCVREGDTVSRLGGDEFVVMLEDLSKTSLEAAAQTEAIANKIMSTLSRLYELGPNTYLNTPSIGITLINQHLSADELMKQADIAMYQAKKAGRNTLRFFDLQMQEVVNARASTEKDLRVAVDKQQFLLYYQIQVDGSRRAVGAEGLIRWLHPQRGLVSPAEFIPLAEETGLILSIGQWVLETACIQLKHWQHQALTRDLTISVNVSAKQFRENNFVEQVQSAVLRHAINPYLLKLEPTESILLDDIENIVATMNELRTIGIHFALDDFGTGFSSLQYLKRLPLNQLKIDQSFVRDLETDINGQAIVRTIVAMAKSLGLEIIAEGVETDGQRQLLQFYGCDQYQGYLFGKPMPVEQFEILLREDGIF